MKMSHEKPSILSKRVLRTFKLNETETSKLEEQLSKIDHNHILQSVAHVEDVTSLKKSIKTIQKIKKRMQFSVERRRHLANQGITINERTHSIEDFVKVVDKVIKTRKHNNKNLYVFYEQNAIGLPANQNVRQIPEKEMGDEKSMDGSSTQSSPLLTKRRLSQGQATNEGLFLSDISWRIRIISPPLKGRDIKEVYKDMERQSRADKEKATRKQLDARSPATHFVRKKTGERKSFSKTSMISDSETIKRYPSKRELQVKHISQNLKNERLAIKRAASVGSGLECAGRKAIVNSAKPRSKSAKDFFRFHCSQGGNASEKRRVKAAWGREEEKTEYSQKSSEQDDDVAYQALSETETEIEEKETMQNEGENEAETEIIEGIDRSFDALMKRSLSKQHMQVLPQNPTPKHTDSTEDNQTEPKSPVTSSTNNFRPLKVAWKQPMGSNRVAIQKEDKLDRDCPHQKWRELMKRVSKDVSKGKALDKVRYSSHKAENEPKIKKEVIKLPKENIIYDANPEKSVSMGYSQMQITVAGKKSLSIFMPRFKHRSTSAYTNHFVKRKSETARLKNVGSYYS